MGSPVWSRDGIIAVANAHKAKVNRTFVVWGEACRIPETLFNAGLEGVTRDARLDFLEGDGDNMRLL